MEEKKYYEIGQILENGRFVRGKTDNGEIYKNERAFAHKQGTCYIPDLSEKRYSHEDFLRISKGNEKIARVIFQNIDWQHPETYLEELEGMGEVRTCEVCEALYLTGGDDYAVHEECFTVPADSLFKIGDIVNYNGERWIIGDLDESPSESTGMYPTNLNYYVIKEDKSDNTFVHYTEVSEL